MIILFLYSRGSGWCSRQTEPAKVEQDVRYWLGKSPGIHEIEQIIAFEPANVLDETRIMDIIRDEERRHEETKRLESERAEFRRLKAKFEP